jgi:hypothetical protein
MLRMRRKTDKDIRREYGWLVIGSVILILLGLLFAILPNVIPPVSYDSLQTKEVTITAFKRHIGGRRGHTYDYILTSEGEKFNLSGDYQRAHLNTLLTEGTTAIIKWYRNVPFRTLLLEEMYIDGERVVTYDNDRPSDWWAPLIGGGFFCVLGAGGLLMFRNIRNSNRKKQKMRDERILRKYGK